MFTNYLLYFVGIFVFKFYATLLFNYDSTFDSSLPKHARYDFIIVGTGSAGSVIAANLIGRVLVLDAGSRGDSSFFNIPIVQPLLQRSSYDWNYATITQKNACLALHNNQSHWPLGRIHGGSHRLNNMVYHRGHHTDYSSFMTKEEAEQFFQENEENSQINPGRFRSSFSEAFVEAGETLGFNDFIFSNLTHFNGRRFTEIDRWKSMQIPPESCLNAIVTRIIFDKKNPKRAIGVEFKKQGKLQHVLGKNIIISAGSIGSPKLLLLSGIGPNKHLKEIGIEIRENLPVGENLQDHVTTGLDLILLNQTVGLSISDLMNPLKILDFLFDKKGSPLAFAGSDAIGFANLNYTSNIPDLSFMVLPVGLVADHGLHLRKVVNIRDDIWEDHFKPLTGQTTVSILPIVLHPKSKGTVRLRSGNYLDPPEINPNYLNDFDDVTKLILGIRIIEKLVETPAMRQLGAEINPKPFPGCERIVFGSNEYWECYVRHMTLTMFHPVGTCKMGDYEDPSTVVLKNFQVKNIENLFVVDGSVLPKTPSANPHAIIAMIARKYVHEMLEK